MVSAGSTDSMRATLFEQRVAHGREPRIMRLNAALEGSIHTQIYAQGACYRPLSRTSCIVCLVSTGRASECMCRMTEIQRGSVTSLDCSEASLERAIKRRVCSSRRTNSEPSDCHPAF